MFFINEFGWPYMLNESLINERLPWEDFVKDVSPHMLFHGCFMAWFSFTSRLSVEEVCFKVSIYPPSSSPSHYRFNFTHTGDE